MKTPTLCVLVCAFMILGGADAQWTLHCSPGWSLIYGRCFGYVPAALTWAAAEKNCQRLGGHLASVHHIYEQHGIQRLLWKRTHIYTRVWLGGSDCQAKGAWLWSDGTRFNYRYCGAFDKRSWTQHCLQMNSGVHRCWDHLRCNRRIPSICAKKPLKVYG